MTNTFFDITGADIEKLNDTDLRILIGLLCEAEVFKRTHTNKGVLYGGHQDAPDGGIDVEVNAAFPASSIGFIPRDHVGFQVKNQK